MSFSLWDGTADMLNKRELAVIRQLQVKDAFVLLVWDNVSGHHGLEAQDKLD